MSKIEELDKLERAIKDSEIRLKSIQSAIEQIDKEIAALTPHKRELEENLEFHKKGDAPPLLHEHRKTKTELVKTKNRLSSITNDRKKANDACKQIEDILEKFKKDHAELLKTSENNVLRVMFGGRRGKK